MRLECRVQLSLGTEDALDEQRVAFGPGPGQQPAGPASADREHPDRTAHVSVPTCRRRRCLCGRWWSASAAGVDLGCAGGPGGGHADHGGQRLIRHVDQGCGGFSGAPVYRCDGRDLLPDVAHHAIPAEQLDGGADPVERQGGREVHG